MIVMITFLNTFIVAMSKKINKYNKIDGVEVGNVFCLFKGGVLL